MCGNAAGRNAFPGILHGQRDAGGVGQGGDGHAAVRRVLDGVGYQDWQNAPDTGCVGAYSPILP
jgi:hypothetical protein